MNLLYGLALGQLAGVGTLVMALCGAPVDLNLGSWHIQGAPVVFVPFTIACRVFGGFKVS